MTTRSQMNLWILILNIAFIGKVSLCQPDQSDNLNNSLSKSISYINIDSDSVNYYSGIAFSIAKKIGDHNSMLESILNRIKSNIKTGNLIEAKELCDSADWITEKYNLYQRIPQVKIYRGNVFQLMGFNSEALEIFLELEKRKRIEGFEKDDIDLYYYMSMVYDAMGDKKNHFYFLNKSLDLALIFGNDSDIFPIYLYYINSSDKIDIKMKYSRLVDSLLLLNPRLTYEEVAFRNSQALLYKALGDFELSRFHYIKAIKIATKNNFSNDLSVLLNNYSYLLMAELKYDSAKACLDSALIIAQKIMDLEIEAVILDTYKDFFKKTGDFKNAVKFNELAVIKDAEFREQQKIQRSQYLTALFETEQKEKEILKKENEIAQLWLYFFAAVAVLIAAIGLIMYYKQKVSLGKSRVDAIEKGKSLELANAVIKAQDDERKRLAMDLHDGLGARLGTLRFAIDSCFKTHDKYNDVINSISQIHQNIRDLSHRMLPSQLEDSGLKEAIKDLITPINSTTKFKIHFDTNLESRLSNKLEINIYFIIYELINNATRHSIGKAIFVQLYTHDDIINLSVENGGNWYNYEKNSKGIGIKNIKTRVEYLQGKLTIESGNSETVTMIEIPISKND